MKMIALRTTWYAGKSKRQGEVFDVADKHVKVLTKLRKAKPYQEEKTEKVAIAEGETKISVVEPTEEAEISTRTGKPKRQYRRRDMQAE
jgi:hypothetical protein